MSWISRILGKDIVAVAPGGVAANVSDAGNPIDDAHLARDAYWDRIGVSDKDLISYTVNPQLLGAPPWPGQQQSFRLVRTGESLIIASEGLSDPYPDTHEKGGVPNCGLGLEVLIEIAGMQNESLEDIHSSWAFSVIEQFAQNAAGNSAFLTELQRLDIMSMELFIETEIEGWTKGGRVGALIGVPVAPNFRKINELPAGGAQIVPLTLIRTDELAACVAGRAEARKGLSSALIAKGHGHRVELGRSSVI